LHCDGHVSGFGDEQVCPLHDDDCDEVCGLCVSQGAHVEALIVEAVVDFATFEDGGEVWVSSPECAQVHSVSPKRLDEFCGQ